MPHPAAFIDRDGTLIVEHGFLSDPAGVQPLPGAVEAVRSLNAHGIHVIVVTNQSGVARGFFGEDIVRAVNSQLIDVFAAQGAIIAQVYYCPHYPSPNEPACSCRKPARGMIDQATREFDIDLPSSVVIGDRFCDVKLGHGVGIPGVLVLTGYGREEHAAWTDPSPPDHVAQSLLHAVQWWGSQNGWAGRTN
jgi:D-glycero-D-manno-heptose 1,7-bisphosphate phosphatase